MYLTPFGNDAVILSYMLLSEIFAVVRSADNGTINEPVLQAIYSLYPNTHPLVLL